MEIKDIFGDGATAPLKLNYLETLTDYKKARLDYYYLSILNQKLSNYSDMINDDLFIFTENEMKTFILFSSLSNIEENDKERKEMNKMEKTIDKIREILNEKDKYCVIEVNLFNFGKYNLKKDQAYIAMQKVYEEYPEKTSEEFDITEKICSIL